MSNNMFLTNQQIQDLTNKKLYKYQREALNHMGIEYKTRPDNSLVVSKSHVEKVLGGSTRDIKRQHEPNFDALINA